MHVHSGTFTGQIVVNITTKEHAIIDRVEEGLETEVIHVMFYNEVYVVALGPSVYLLITPAKALGNLLCPKHTSQSYPHY